MTLPPPHPLVRRLALAGSRVERAELAEGLAWGSERITDELAALVAAGDVQHSERMRDYRLAGTPMARRAASELLRSGRQRVLLGRQSPDKATYQVGLALRHGQAVVMAELELPYPSGKVAGLLHMVQALAAWVEPPAAPPPGPAAG